MLHKDNINLVQYNILKMKHDLNLQQNNDFGIWANLQYAYHACPQIHRVTQQFRKIIRIFYWSEWVMHIIITRADLLFLSNKFFSLLSFHTLLQGYFCWSTCQQHPPGGSLAYQSGTHACHKKWCKRVNFWPCGVVDVFRK